MTATMATQRSKASLLAVLMLCAVGCISHAQAAATASKVPRVGVINEQGPKAPSIDAFRRGLRELGYVEGQNIVLEYRHAQGKLDQIPGFVTELLRINIDVLVVGGTVAARAAREQTATVPIVFSMVGDPVHSRLVATLRRPGANLTGLTNLTGELVPKQIELLKDLVPQLSRVAVLVSADEPSQGIVQKQSQDAARALGIEVRVLQVRDPNELASVFATLASWRAQAALAHSSPMFGNELVQLSTLAAVHRLPLLYSRKEFAEVGGLVTYGPNHSDNYRRAAVYVDKILKGAKPGELPVEQPIKFDLIVNLKSAKAFGLEVPPAVLVRATEVIR